MDKQEEIEFLKQRWYEVEVENWELRSKLEDKQDELDAVRRRNQQLMTMTPEEQEKAHGMTRGGIIPKAFESRRAEYNEQIRKAIRESDWK